jgi:hypothetical protein
MFRRIMLAITFVAALGAVGLATPNTADAWRWDRSYYGSYYGPQVYYRGGYARPYRTYYPGGYAPRYYAPRYYSRYYGPNYYGAPGYYYRPAPRVAFRIGF